MITNSIAFKRRHGIKSEDSLSLQEISNLSGMPRAALQEVFNKGVGAFHTNRSAVRPSVSSPEQWAFGRVYSFVMRQPTTFGGADKHITKKYRIS